MNLAEQLKETIKKDGNFDETAVTDFLIRFFKENPTRVMTVDFFDHFEWREHKNPFRINDPSMPFGSLLVTLPCSWAMDFTSFVRNQGFCVLENRNYYNNKLHWIRVSLV